MIDLSDYIDSLMYEINAVGSTVYDPSNTEATGRLRDAFWTCKMYGLQPFLSYTCDDDGIVTPYAAGTATQYTIPTPLYPDPSNPINQGTNDLDREYIQLIVLIAGHNAMITELRNSPISSTYKAGDVESSTSKSAQGYLAALKAITAKIDIVLTRLSDLGATSVAVLDAVIDSTNNIEAGLSWWVRGSEYNSSLYQGEGY